VSIESIISRRTAGRIAAVLFLASGLVTLISPLLPAPPTLNAGAVACIGVLGILAAVPAWFLPWQRWPRRASLVLVFLALPLISAHNVFGGSDPYRWGLFYVVLAAWLGLAQPRGTFLLVGPFMTASYVLPLLSLDHPVWAVSSALYAIPACGLVAETSAWAMKRAARATKALSESENRLRYIAHHDSLTGLSNRADFMMSLARALETVPARASAPIALLFIDVDRFKTINDYFGHATGDALLQEVSKRLSACVRSEDVVARLGGDEFTVLLQGVGSPADVYRLSSRIREQLNTRLVIGGYNIELAASVGIAVATVGDSAEDLMKRADAAMYQAKSATQRQRDCRQRHAA
jgi:diguanylate cyclase (GGDEF)-like protein